MSHGPDLAQITRYCHLANHNLVLRRRLRYLLFDLSTEGALISVVWLIDALNAKLNKRNTNELLTCFRFGSRHLDAGSSQAELFVPLPPVSILHFILPKVEREDGELVQFTPHQHHPFS